MQKCTLAIAFYAVNLFLLMNSDNERFGRFYAEYYFVIIFIFQSFSKNESISEAKLRIAYANAKAKKGEIDNMIKVWLSFIKVS